MKDEAEVVASEIEQMGRRSHVFCVDVSKRKEVEEMCASHLRELGPIFAMVANAGIAQIKRGLDVTEDDMRRMFEVNVFGIFNCYQVAAKQMIEQDTKGRVIGCSRSVRGCRGSKNNEELIRLLIQQYCGPQSISALSTI